MTRINQKRKRKNICTHYKIILIEAMLSPAFQSSAKMMYYNTVTRTISLSMSSITVLIAWSLPVYLEIRTSRERDFYSRLVRSTGKRTSMFFFPYFSIIKTWNCSLPAYQMTRIMFTTFTMKRKNGALKKRFVYWDPYQKAKNHGIIKIAMPSPFLRWQRALDFR